MEAVRSKLMDTAQRYADSIQSQPGVVGIVLYGSLASGDPPELTQFSDVDLSLVVDRELPAHFSEHRLRDAVKVDVILFHESTLRDLASRRPERLYQGGWLLHYLIKSLLLGRADTILFDPTGQITRAKQKLNEWTTYHAMVLPDARRWLDEAEREYVAASQQQLQQGNHREAVKRSGDALWLLEDILKMLAATKQLELATDRLGVPQFSTAAAHLRAMLSPAMASVEAAWQAAQSLWRFTFEHVFRRAEAELLGAGVEEPARLELPGDHSLFWGGNRIHEFGRVIAEVNLSLTWSRFELVRGNLNQALAMLWACNRACTTRRCQGLASALLEVGYDISSIVTQCLESAQFQRLADESDRAMEETQSRNVTAAQAERAVLAAQELKRMVDGVIASA
jgi:predicted nucleotidyltransferase